jgi:hypothetical protein
MTRLSFRPLPLPNAVTRVQIEEQERAVRSYTRPSIHNWASATERALGTCVMMRAGGRLFAVTAAHCALDNTEIFFGSQPLLTDRARIVRIHRHHELDIAVVELEDRPEVMACHVDQICLDVPIPATAESDPTTLPIFRIIGNPSCRATMQRDGILVTDQVAFGTNVVEVEENRVGLYYHREAHALGASGEYEVLPLPPEFGGFSGSGVWLFHQTDGFFNPSDHIRLYGIIYSWFSESRRVNAVPSRVIVELLLQHYPDMRNELHRLFPTLRGQ